MDVPSHSWPISHADAIVVSNLESDVAVLTLWTDARRIAAGLDPASFAACGNLYSATGLAFLARNLLANPRIRYLVLCGTDLTGTAAPVIGLFEQGPDAQGRLPGGVRLDAGLSPELIETLRRGVRLVNLVGLTDPARLRAEIAALPRLPPWGEPIVVPPPGRGEAVLTAEPAGFLVRHASAARAWVQFLKLALQFGTSFAGPRPGRELLVACTVLAGEGDAEEAARWFGPPLVGDRPAAALGHPRLLEHRSAGALGLTAFYPRLDLFSAWPARARALRQEHRRRAAEAGLHPGPLTIVANRLQLLDRDAQHAAEVVARRYPRTLPWRSDPRGLFWIRVEQGTIMVEHGTQQGPTGRRWEGQSAEQLCRQILNEQLVGYPEHAAYLGRELQKAELAAALGLAYRQDEPLNAASLARPSRER